MPYTKECADYKCLRIHDYHNYARMIAINSLSTPELVEYFVRALADSNPTLNFNVVDHGDFEIAVQCNDRVIYQGSYLEVEKLFRQSSDLLLNMLKDKLE